MTGSKIAEQWSKLFVLKAFNGDKQRLVFTSESYAAEGRNILSAVMRDLNMAQDFLYDEVYNALEAIAESGLEAVKDAPHDYIVVDVYTSGLTAWLASSINHVHYLDNEAAGGDGSHMLMQAQGDAIEEIWLAVVQAVQNEVDAFDPFYEGE